MFRELVGSLRAKAAEDAGVTEPILAVDGKTSREATIALRLGRFAFGEFLGQ